ncbi:thioredoxin family protein [Lutibacter sp. TH_r2]|uniref:thioredoxin family protein n=1 Tax=Lutibacter sp. TH_r2 TaxID=3082083 RepID=UPI002953B5AC|nr:thioredoxin family protein [Lutibacter sp. TH_r2]MDV7186135.1 thioredoxin family protein [Lutibacter sp. TH_r2]
MKKIILSLFITTLFFACNQQPKVTKATLNEDGDLIGVTTKNQFLQEPFNEWFESGYEDYSLNNEIISKLKPLINNVTIKAFMGTWCSDSQEQTPIFYKVLEATEFNMNNLELIAVDRDKVTPDSLEKGFNIDRVPTFIFYKNNEEIGRFVEYPRETVEADMLKIISGEPYKHSYQE